MIDNIFWSTPTVVLSTGQRTRMRSQLPKVMLFVSNLPLLGQVLAAVEVNENEVLVVNDCEPLLAAGQRFQQRRCRALMRLGAGLLAADTRFFGADTLAIDVCIEPRGVYGPVVSGGSGLSARAFSRLQNVCLKQSHNQGVCHG
ncbi:hypothetical protein LRS56_06060 [Pseudomonas poae]|nr:hypothetical protein LRS56_06060 [Pseudomonas poae]